MQLPALLLRNNSNVHKNQFGHVCVIGGSSAMLGAAALTALAAMRSGAGLVTLAVPKSLNAAAQKKISNVIMTFPLKETSEATVSFSAFDQIRRGYERFDAFAIGPGLSQQFSTRKLVLKIISTCPKPLVIDADALNALAGNLECLKKMNSAKVLTPHPGEMARLMGEDIKIVERSRREKAMDFSVKYNCVTVLKGHRTVVASAQGSIYVNTTGNPGMATAGSGDVLTGMIAAFLAQGLSGFDAAKWGVYWHGRAGDLAARAKTRIAMIASDIIEEIPVVFKKMR